MVLIQRVGDTRRVIFEQTDPEQEQAWETLIDTGKNPTEWMYMETKEVPGLRFHSFKNIEQRNYLKVVQVLDPKGCFDELEIGT